MNLPFFTALMGIAFHPAWAGFQQGSQSDYEANFDAIISASYAVIDDLSVAPSNLLSQCLAKSGPAPTREVTVSGGSVVGAASVAAQCGSDSVCVIPSGVKLLMDNDLDVGALVIKGKLEWTDITQGQSLHRFLCAGYVAVEENGSFSMSLQQNGMGWVYIKDNGATHSMLRSRAFGTAGTGLDHPTVDIDGREMVRTWTLLATPLKVGDTTMEVMHDPTRMGWRVGDRIGVSTTKSGRDVKGQTFRVVGLTENGLQLDQASTDDHDAEFFSGNDSPILRSAEVVNLSRNIVITGDDFSHVQCDSSLPEAVTGEQTSTQGCKCASFRSKCTMGLHTIAANSGTTRIRNTRVEKCGQRGVEGKYCLHFHQLEHCPDCLYENNALENSHQRGIIVHGTHGSKVSNNVMYGVRGAGIYIEDGNEMHNSIEYNVIICPWALGDSTLHGCTVPGTSNREADTSVNQAGIFTLAATNDLIGNRVSGSFNGMLLQAGGIGRGSAYGKVCTSDSALGRWEGNTFHNHGRFGTYTLGSNYPKITDQSISNNGYNIDKSMCDGFDALSGGIDHGIPAAIVNNFDYGNVFVGHYNAGDIQYRNHVSIDNDNLIYWKETKNFANGCSAHMTGGYYAEGNMALPDQGTFIIEDTTFGEGAKLEANHHCNVGTTGVLCMPQYVLHNVKWKNRNSGNWVWFQDLNFQGHNANQNHGGVFTLSPASIAAIASGQVNNDEMIFPPGYVSLVSSKFTYLLSLPNSVCTLSSTQYGIRYGGGILCKVPLRALKIYSRGLTSGSAPSLNVDVWSNSLGVNGQTGTADASQDVNFHQIGSDGRTQKQGFSLPVIPGTTYSYHLSLNAGDRTIPESWIIEFSDPVMGNRWAPEQLQLAVQGRNCGAEGLVSSQHDRRFLWSGDEFIDDSAWGGHGACVNRVFPPPDMPSKDCSSTQGMIEATECPDLCPVACDSTNSFCHCGTATCQCKPGFSGVDCSLDLCAAARCGEHGKCAARYLGSGSSSALPITNSDSACICDVGWSGPLCDSNPCAEQGRTCSGHGTCQAISEKETMCKCDEGYSGENCETTCTGFCQGNGGVYPYGCASSLDGVVAYHCGSTGGCSYQNDPTATAPTGFCTYKSEVLTGNNCDCANNNDCMIPGTCRSDGTCSDVTVRSDGTPCNSVPFGICKAGVCAAPPAPPSTEEPTQSPTVTSGPTKTPTSAPPTKTPTKFPTKSPTKSPTKAPAAAADPYEMRDCTGVCQGSYPFGCADNLPGKVSYRCDPNGGCHYGESLDDPFPWSSFCVFKTVAPPTPTPPTPVSPTPVPTKSPTKFPTKSPTKSPTKAPAAAADPYEMRDCTGVCQGSYPFSCADNLPGKVSYRCDPNGGCHYGDSLDDEFPYSGFCVFKTVAPPTPTPPTPVLPTPVPTKSPTKFPTKSPTKSPTKAPAAAADPYEMRDCTGVCQGSYPFGCADNLPGKVSYRCDPNGGCHYGESLDDAFPYSGFCVFKTISG